MVKNKKVIITALLLLCASALSSCNTVPEDTATAETSGKEVTVNQQTQAVETQAPVTAEYSVSVYPQPKETVTDKEERTVQVKSIDPSGLTDEMQRLLKNAGFTLYSGGFNFTAGADSVLSGEEYTLTVDESGIKIGYATERGAFYAVQSLRQLYKNGVLPVVQIKDSPAVLFRGVIEGFYGKAYTHQFRLSLFKFMGENKMNTYIYAPKDDEKHRAQWRKSYTGTELEKMKELIGTATENYVGFVYAISPGGDINLGEGYEKDFKALCDKCEAMYTLGVRDFAIFLDDISTLDAQGHAKLLNDFQAKFVKTHDGTSDLLCITTEYTDPMLTSYTDKIAPLLDSDLQLMWTGPGVVPDKITVQSLAKINKKYNRNVFIWWNYPVNDVLINNLYMGACEGLDTELYRSISGLCANPMNEGVASLVPLFTTADYLWSPQIYNKENSLSAAVDVIDPSLHEELLFFIDMTGASPMNGNKSSAEFAELLSEYKKDPKNAETIKKLISAFEKTEKSAAAIKKSGNTAFVKEVSEWLDKTELYGTSGKAFFNAVLLGLESGNTEKLLPLVNTYLSAMEKLFDNSRIVSPDVLAPFFNTVPQKLNEILGIGTQVTSHKATAITNCAAYQSYTVDLINDGDDSSFFWTAGAMWQAANGTEGYIGLDLGEVTDVENIYIASGSGGDFFKYGAVEYSEDGKTFTELKNGEFGVEIYLSNLSFRARFVRIRNTDTKHSDWVKVRVFEVNTSRTPSETAQKAVFTTNMPTYGTNVPEFATDGNINSFFWSSREVRSGDYIMLDLKDITRVEKITLNSGVLAHPTDYINKAVLEYSSDGSKWVKIKDVTQGSFTLSGLEIDCRYIRLTAKQTQTPWLTVAEFSAGQEDRIPEYFTAIGSDASHPVKSAFDKNACTYFCADTDMVLKADEETTYVVYSISGVENVKYTVINADGSRQPEKLLSYLTEINVPAGGKAEIAVNGSKVCISEITAK